MMPGSATDTIDNVLAEVSLRFDVSADQILSASRASHVLMARHIAVYLAHSLSGKTPAQIGTSFGGRDYTNVLMYIRGIERQCAGDEALKALINDLEQAVRRRLH
ncbi:MAG: hypothetical protein M5U16_01410 [Hyphomicrobium sp.]|nr:hypothetical protein [Hyphomicrobium sp.]